jgi:hypothetical protein
MTREEIIAKREADFPCLIGSGTPLNLMPHRYVGGGYKYYYRTTEEHSHKNARHGTAPEDMKCMVDADPRLEAMMQTASKFMPSGWQIYNICAQQDITKEEYMKAGNGVLLRGLRDTINHFSGLAIDVGIRINDGTLLCNIRNGRSYRTYELLYQLICRLIQGDPTVVGHPGYISYEDGTICNWGDLVLGKPDTDGIVRTGGSSGELGARRQFRMEDNGSGVMVRKEFFSHNDNGQLIKDIPNGKITGSFGFVPRTAPKYGVRWGGYFGNTKYHMERDMGKKEQQMLHTGEGKIITYLPEVGRWDKSLIPMWDKEGNRVQVLKTNKAGEVIVPHEFVNANHPDFPNIGWDSMHYDFRPGESIWSIGKGAQTLCVPAEKNGTNQDILVAHRPTTDSIVKNMRLPSTPEDCKQMWEETLGIRPPPNLEVRASLIPTMADPLSPWASRWVNPVGTLYNERNNRPDEEPAIVPIVTTSTTSQKSALRTGWERFMRGPGKR